VAGPLGVSAIADIERLMEGGTNTGVAEPGSNIADGGAVGVVEVVAGGENLNDRSAGFVEGVEQSWVKTLG